MKRAWNAKSDMENLAAVETRINGAIQDLTLANQVSRTLAKTMLHQTLFGMPEFTRQA